MSDEPEGIASTHEATVASLRDISTNHAAAIKTMFRGGVDGVIEPHGAPVPATPEEQLAEAQDLMALCREMENQAIYALSTFASAVDATRRGMGAAAAFVAIEDAEAGWLYRVILERAMETADSDASEISEGGHA